MFKKLSFIIISWQIDTNLAIALKNVALEDVGGAISSDVGEDLQIRAVVGDVKDAVDGMVHYLSRLRSHTGLAAATKQLTWTLL